MPLAPLRLKLPIGVNSLLQWDYISGALLENAGHPSVQLMIRLVNLPLPVQLQLVLAAKLALHLFHNCVAPYLLVRKG